MINNCRPRFDSNYIVASLEKNTIKSVKQKVNIKTRTFFYILILWLINSIKWCKKIATAPNVM